MLKKIQTMSRHLDNTTSKIFKSRKELLHRVENWRFKDRTVVFTNGCFDILHKGHISLLCEAADLGDRLVVAVNSDRSVKELKGEGRPMNTQDDRALILAAVQHVSAVIVFDEDTPADLISYLRPDVLVKGGDYSEAVTDPSDPRFVVGSDTVRTYGGVVHTIPLVEGFSTTGLVEKIRS